MNEKENNNGEFACNSNPILIFNLTNKVALSILVSEYELWIWYNVFSTDGFCQKDIQDKSVKVLLNVLL